jgi:hypothetical protein
MKALAVIVVLETAVLAGAVGTYLQSEGHKRFPASVAVASPARGTVPVAVSVDLGSRGVTLTTAWVARGGQAVAVPFGGHARSSPAVMSSG